LPSAAEAAYDEASALAHAPRLSRPLLVIHGTTDDNVYFTHSLKLSQALFRAGKPFEILPLAGFTHLVPDPLVKKALSRRVLDFFRENLCAPGRSARPGVRGPVCAPRARPRQTSPASEPMVRSRGDVTGPSRT